MNNTKKVKLLGALLIMCVAILCSCSKESNTASNDVTSTSVEQSPDIAETMEPDNSEDETVITNDNEISDEETLESILNDIEETVQIGTAGSSLRAVIATVPLMNWAVETSMTTDEIKTVATEWIANKNLEEGQATELAEQFGQVKSTYKQLLEDDQEDLLETAGCGDAPYPWSKEPIEQIEVLMETVEECLPVAAD